MQAIDSDKVTNDERVKKRLPQGRGGGVRGILAVFGLELRGAWRWNRLGRDGFVAGF